MLKDVYYDNPLKLDLAKLFDSYIGWKILDSVKVYVSSWKQERKVNDYQINI